MLEDDEKRLEYERDQKIPNAGTFTINKEDHTVGNLIRMQLLRDKEVQFAGYQMPHPLEHRCLVKIQTTSSRPTPVTAFKRCIDDLQSEFETLERKFRVRGMHTTAVSSRSCAQEEVQQYRESEDRG